LIFQNGPGMNGARGDVGPGALHGSFTLTRDIDAPLARVWDAYSFARMGMGMVEVIAGRSLIHGAVFSSRSTPLWAPFGQI
jgi:hypothetical protein